MDGYGKRILVVSDDPDGRALLDANLEHEGYAVYTVCDGIVGADEMRKRHFDAVIADYHMPEINGLEFAEFVKIAWPDTPVILVSGELNDVMENVAQSDVRACIRKPYETTMLLSVLRALTQPVSKVQAAFPMV
jgi:two-component system, chemotaxis family, chemotaxis protein CheY